MAAPVRVLGVSPATQQAGRACGVRRPDEFFSRDGPLGARADVRVLTSDGQELWLHRVVLEMWSRLFLDLIAAHEEEMDAMGSSSGSPFVTLALTDTAADLMLLLSCLYPTPYPKDRKQGSTLDAASFLPLLGLADKYHCPQIIDRCAAFAVEHVIPRLATQPCASAAAAADYLQLPPPRPGSPSTGALDWVVRCLELAVRLDLEELTESTAALLGRRFFDWRLQDPENNELMARVARVLTAELFVRLVLQAIPTPSDATTAAAGMTTDCAKSAASGIRHCAVRSEALGVVGGGAVGGGGGPRIVPVVVAAAGPAAVALQHAGAAAAAAAPPPLPPAPQVLNQHVQAAPLQPQPFVAHPNMGWQPQPHFFMAGANGPAHAMPFGGGGGEAAAPVPFAEARPVGGNGAHGGIDVRNQPEPLLGPAHHHGW